MIWPPLVECYFLNLFSLNLGTGIQGRQAAHIAITCIGEEAPENQENVQVNSEKTP